MVIGMTGNVEKEAGQGRGVLEKGYIVTAGEMREYDRNTIQHFGMPSMVLMERAALAVAEEIEKRSVPGMQVLIVAGCGNNGGDGIAAGRILRQHGYAVDFCLIGDREKCSGETKAQCGMIEKYGCPLQDKIGNKEYDIIVDALFGIGLSRNLEGQFAKAVQEINESKAFVCSVDIPSGIHTDSGEIMGEAVKANLTVTFAFKKPGHILYPGCGYCGEIICGDIGITQESFLGQNPKIYTFYGAPLDGMPDRNGDGNKGTFGKVLVIAGSAGMSGACELCARSVYRMGAGMVKILTPEENRIIVQTNLPEALLSTYQVQEAGKTETAGDLRQRLEKDMEWADCILIGPGIGKGREACAMLEQVLAESKKPLVIDADGLNLLAENENLRQLLKGCIKEKRDVVLTPHLAEFARLFGSTVEDIKRNLLHRPKEMAEKYGCIVVCKDARTVVAAPSSKEIYLNTSGNDGMATAGMGDVLTGVIGGLMAQGMDGRKAACLGVYIHGKAGDEAAKIKGRYGLMARDVINGLSEVLKAK